MLSKFFKGSLNRFGYEIRNFKSTANTNPLYALRRLLRNDASVIFDVGANKGDVTATYQTIFSQATIYAFEPFPVAYEVLKSRFKTTSKIRTFSYAIGAEAGKKSLKIYSSDVLNSFLEMEDNTWLKSIDVSTSRAITTRNKDDGAQMDVDCITLDAFTAEHKLTHIDLLKLDVQGVELQVLNGARGLLSSGAVDVLFCEANFAPQYKGQAYFRDVDKAMSDHGYRLFGLYELISGSDGSIGFGNAIFISDAFHQKIAKNGQYWRPL